MARWWNCRKVYQPWYSTCNFYQLFLADTDGQRVKHLHQFIAHIITANKPLWVIDIIGSFGTSNVLINKHFTSNPAGASATFELDDIPIQVLGGYEISGPPIQQILVDGFDGCLELDILVTAKETAPEVLR